MNQHNQNILNIINEKYDAQIRQIHLNHKSNMKFFIIPNIIVFAIGIISMCVFY
jgi:hypothetical protein